MGEGVGEGEEAAETGGAVRVSRVRVSRVMIMGVSGKARSTQRVGRSLVRMAVSRRFVDIAEYGL